MGRAVQPPVSSAQPWLFHMLPLHDSFSYVRNSALDVVISTKQRNSITRHVCINQCFDFFCCLRVVLLSSRCLSGLSAQLSPPPRQRQQQSKQQQLMCACLFPLCRGCQGSPALGSCRRMCL
jgi:hypothetical protein